MSEKEIVSAMLERVPDYKMPYIIGYIQGLIADEALDDLFCLKLAERAEAEAEEDDNELIPESEVRRILGVDSDEV